MIWDTDKSTLELQVAQTINYFVDKAVAKEREACAVTAWTKGMELHHPVNEPRAREVGSECAKAIRARGNE